MEIIPSHFSDQTSPESWFSDSLPRGSCIYYIGNEDPQTSGRFLRAGHSVKFHDMNRDLRLMSLTEASLDAIWWNDASRFFTLEDAHRILNTFFRGLRPGGLLAMSFLKDEKLAKRSHIWKVTALQSLLRQSGYSLLAPYEQNSFALYLCRRTT